MVKKWKKVNKETTNINKRDRFSPLTLIVVVVITIIEKV